MQELERRPQGNAAYSHAFPLPPACFFPGHSTVQAGLGPTSINNHKNATQPSPQGHSDGGSSSLRVPLPR